MNKRNKENDFFVGFSKFDAFGPKISIFIDIWLELASEDLFKNPIF